MDRAALRLTFANRLSRFGRIWCAQLPAFAMACLLVFAAPTAKTGPARRPAPEPERSEREGKCCGPSEFSPGELAALRFKQFQKLNGNFALEVLNRKEARHLLGAMTDAEFVDFLRRPSVDGNDVVARFLKDEQLAAPAHRIVNGAEHDVTDLKRRFASWLTAAETGADKASVRALDSAKKWQLDDYIRKQEPDGEVNFDNEVRHFARWLTESDFDVTRKRHALNAQFEPHGGKLHDVLDGLYEERQRPYARAGLDAFIARHPTLRRMNTEGWNFDASSVEHLERLLLSLEKPLPGGAIASSWPAG